MLKFPDFENIKVSTKTFTAVTNLVIDLEKVYNNIPITPYFVPPKKRGRKRKEEVGVTESVVPWGSIIKARYKGELKGVELKPKRNKSDKIKYGFRNSMTLVIVLDKPVNFKICTNGTFQMTGCKNKKHAVECVVQTWNFLQENPDFFTFNSGTRLNALFIPAMRNIDFSLGFKVDREKLNLYMTKQEDFHCLLETSFGYTGVNIKVPITEDISQMKILEIQENTKGEIIHSSTTYQKFLDKLNVQDRNNKMKAIRYNTFLVFHSGKVIMSGLTKSFMKDQYFNFLYLIKSGQNQIEEKLEK